MQNICELWFTDKKLDIWQMAKKYEPQLPYDNMKEKSFYSEKYLNVS